MISLSALDQLYCSLGDKFPGVTFLDKSTIYVDSLAMVEIGEGTVIEPFVKLTGQVKIGKNCQVFFGFEGYSFECGDNCELRGVIANSKLGDNCRIEKRGISDSTFGDSCRIGEVAEIKRSDFGNEVTCLHHCYIGDAKVGNGVNIGAGVITANFDGSNKNQTIVEDGAFIGTNVNLIAPIRVGQEAFVAAGSTITRNVAAHALIVIRAKEEDGHVLYDYWEKVGKIWQKMKRK